MKSTRRARGDRHFTPTLLWKKLLGGTRRSLTPHPNVSAEWERPGVKGDRSSFSVPPLNPRLNSTYGQDDTLASVRERERPHPGHKESSRVSRIESLMGVTLPRGSRGGPLRGTDPPKALTNNTPSTPPTGTHRLEWGDHSDPFLVRRHPRPRVEGLLHHDQGFRGVAPVGRPAVEVVGNLPTPTQEDALSPSHSSPAQTPGDSHHPLLQCRVGVLPPTPSPVPSDRGLSSYSVSLSGPEPGGQKHRTSPIPSDGVSGADGDRHPRPVLGGRGSPPRRSRVCQGDGWDQRERWQEKGTRRATHKDSG